MFQGGLRLRKRYVLDAGVLALYFAGREDVKRYVDEMYSRRAKGFMCEVNVAEFLYNYARVFGWDTALARHTLLRNSPISIVSVEEDLTVGAAKLKLKYYNVLSLADCYLIALAKKNKATIITTDQNVRDVNEVPTILIPI